MAQININTKTLDAVGAIVRWALHTLGLALALALAVDVFVWPVPYLGGGGQERLLLAALLVYAGR